MPLKKRTKDLHLPSRVYYKHNAYYYVTRKNKWIKLGKSFAEAMREYGNFHDELFSDKSLNAVFNRYMVEVSTTKALTTHKRELECIKILKVGFSTLHPSELSPVLIYKFMDLRSKQVSPATVNKEKAVLSSICDAGVRWGILTKNCCKDVRPMKIPKTTAHYISDKEFKAFYDFASPTLQIFMGLALCTGLRRSDLLKLKFSDCTENGLLVYIGKTTKPILFKWNSILKNIVNTAKTLHGNLQSTYIVSTLKGQFYSPNGFQSLWREAMKKAIEKEIITKKFKIHDLRRKAASDADSQGDIEYARRLLGHSSQGMTKKYIGKPEIVNALNVKKLLDK